MRATRLLIRLFLFVVMPLFFSNLLYGREYRFNYRGEIYISAEVADILKDKGVIPVDTNIITLSKSTKLQISSDRIIAEVNADTLKEVEDGRYLIENFISRANDILRERNEELARLREEEIEKKESVYIRRRKDLQDKINNLQEQISTEEIKFKEGEEQRLFLARKIKEWELERDSLLKTYTPEYPKVKAIEKKIEEAKEAYGKLPSGKKLGMLKTQLEKYRREYEQIEEELKRLNEEKRKSASTIEFLRIDRESNYAVKQDNYIILSVIIGSVILSVVIYLFSHSTSEIYLHRFSNYIKLPKISVNSEIFKNPVIKTDSSLVKEIKDDLLKMKFINSVSKVFVTSFSHGEGKTTVSVILGNIFSFLQKKRILIVSMQPRDIFRININIPLITTKDIGDSALWDRKIVKASDIITTAPAVIQELNSYGTDMLNFMFIDKNVIIGDFIEVINKLQTFEYFIIIDTPFSFIGGIDKGSVVFLVHRRSAKKVSQDEISKLDKMNVVVVYNS